MQDLPSLFPEQDEPGIHLGKTDVNSHQSKSLHENNVNHIEEVIIGLEQGTTFPTKIGTTMCNALIDTGATRSCMSERYYRKLQLAKIHLLQNVNVKSATSSNLTPVGLVNCTLELGETKFMTLPGRALAVVHVNNNLKPEQSRQMYEIEPNYHLTEEYPNLYIIPMMHNVDVHKTENVPLVVINFLTDSVYLLKGEIMGFMQN